MAEYEYEENLDEDIYDDSDSKLVKSLRKQIDGLQKSLKERDSLIEEFSTYSHEASVGEILDSFGLNPRIAQFIPSDVEADEDAVAEWLNEYGDAFGITAVEESDPSMDPDAQIHEQISAFEEGGVDPQVGMDLHSRIAGATSAEELSNLLRG